MTHDALKALEGGDLDALLCLFETAKGEPFKPTATQRDIIRSIILKERRLAVNCMTRYGKSYCISIAIILLSMLVKGNRTVIVAPTVNHTDILMRYVAANIGKHSHPMIRDMIVDSQVRGKRGLSNEVSRKRITFKNGSEI